MIGLKAERYSVASISSAICSSRPLSTASVTGSIAVVIDAVVIRSCRRGRCRKFVGAAEFQHLRRADDRVERVEIEHLVAEGVGGAVARQRRVEMPAPPWRCARTMPPGKITSEKPSACSSVLAEDRRLAALDHVGHQRQPRAEPVRDRRKLRLVARRLDEQHVGAGLARSVRRVRWPARSLRPRPHRCAR